MMLLKDCHSGELKIESYYEAYDREFDRLRLNKMKVLEIGVQFGGSLVMWKKYFPNSDILGVDIADQRTFGKNMPFIRGDQADPEFLKTLGSFDIIIDDGGHTMKQQQVSFATLFPLLNKGGIYVIEDLHTSFWPEFFDIDTKTLDIIDELSHGIHEYADKTSRLAGYPGPKNPFDIYSVRMYPSICFIEKK